MTHVLRRLLVVALALGSGACASGAGPATSAVPSPSADPDNTTPAPTLVQAGAPGEDSRTIDASDVSLDDLPSWTEADAAFMSGMIHHHAQALQMTALIDERSRSAGVHQMGLRMEISQRDEIRLMQDWLGDRGLTAPQVVLEEGPEQGMMPSMDGMDGMQGMAMMPGMLSAQQMADLRGAEGTEFDRLWLEYMIQHHTGAITMVEELFASPGAGQDSIVFRFASDVDADQRAEIDRMRRLLAQMR